MKFFSPILLLVVFFLFSLSVFSQVTVAYVTDTSDSGAGSLRDAIENSGEDTVIIDIAGKLKLETSISLSNDVVILGPSPIHFQIDLSDLLSVQGMFKFNGNNLILTGVAIEDGNNSRPFEISTTNFPGNIKIRDCLFENNSTSGNGAVFNVLDLSGKTLQISRCSFFDNLAENTGAGGVIYSASSTGTINVYNSTFYNNTGSAGGGAIRVKGSVLNAINNTFYNNTISTGSGTAINFNSSAVVTLKNNIFQANSPGLVVDNGGLGLALGSDNNFTNRDISQTPIPVALSTAFTLSANLDLNSSFITDGFGLKYFVFNSNTGSCIDVDQSAPIEELDARRSWRDMFSNVFVQPTFTNSIDAGAIEYTPLIVNDPIDSGNPGSLTAVFEDYNNMSNNSNYSIVFEIPTSSAKQIQLAGNHSIFLQSDISSLIINGFTQEGSRVPGPKNSLGVLQNGIMGVEFVADLITSLDPTLSIQTSSLYSGRIFISGISFTNNNFSSALSTSTTGSLSIEGNHIGVDLNGNTSNPNKMGVSSSPASAVNSSDVLSVGVPRFMNGYNHNARNVISSNTDYQVKLNLNSTVLNNFIGLNSQGNNVFTSSSKGLYYETFIADSGIKTIIGGEDKKQANYIVGQDTAVYFKQSHTSTISNNYVGFLYDKIAAGNNNTGLVIEECINVDIIYNQIGNCLNGNNGNAVSLKNSDATNVTSNKIGIALDSSSAPVSGSGINIIGAFTNENGFYTVKGGSNIIEGNIITHSAVSGINYDVEDFFYFGSSYTTEATSFYDTIMDNIIGYDTTGNNNPFANGNGVYINDKVKAVHIVHNLIGRNLGAGIAISDSALIGIEISRNAIFGNNALGIDLDNNSTPNISNTNLPKSNNSLIPPETINAIYCSADSTINLKLNLIIPDNSKEYKIEFFTTDFDNTEGKVFVKDTTFSPGSLTTGASVETLSFPVSSIANGLVIVTTLTETGTFTNAVTSNQEILTSTSEFSSSFTIAAYSPTLSVFDAEICIGDSTALTFQNYGTLQSFASTNLNSFQTINDSTYYFFGVSPGTGTISILVDSLGCSLSLDTTFIKNTGPSSAGLSTVAPSCNGDADGSAESNPVGGTAPFSYEWNSNSPISNNTYNSLSSGTYTVKVLDANNCSILESFQIIDPSPLTLTLTPSSPTCFGGTGSISVTSTAGGSSPYTYSIDNGSTYQTQTTFNGLFAANYSIQVLDLNGCLASNSTTITEPLLIRDTVSQTVCDGVSVTQGSNTYTTTGVYTDTLTAINGCDSLITLNLTVEALPTVNVGPDTSICFGNTFELSNRSSAGDWQTTTGNSLSTFTNVTINSDTSFINQVTGLNCSNTDQLFIFVIQPTTGVDVQTACGSYEWIDGNTYNTDTTGATFTLTGSNGCDSIVTLNLTIINSTPAKPILESSFIFCEDQSSTILDSEPSNQGIEHFFFYGTTQDTSSTHMMNVSGLTASNDSLYAFVGNSFGCLSDTAVTAIDFVSKIVSNSSYFEICEGDSVEFQFNNPNNILDSITWQVNNSSSFEDTSIIVVNPAEVGLYNFSIFSNGCRFIDSIEVTLALDCDEVDQVTTNAFSPNGGNTQNTAFIIDLEMIEGPELVAVTIYNRWGDIIYQTDNYDNGENVWDGTNQSGEMMPEGTYFYVIESEINNFTTSGWVYLDLKN